MSQWLGEFSQLHLLRPHWLWALLALPALALWWRVRRRRANAWRNTVDPHLLPHLLEAGQDRRTRYGAWLAMLGGVLAVLALAGPSWRQTEQALWQSRAPLVIALDLSSAALAADLPPSRLAQARSKIATLLRERDGGQVGLVAYAGDAFTVAPLTDDAANVALFLDSLSPDVMPVDGQRGDRAVAWSARLLRRAGFERGDILLLTDHSDARTRAAAAEAASAGYRVFALGLGSVAGAAIRRSDGSIVGVKLDPDSLRDLASAGGGAYAAMSGDDEDLRALGVLTPKASDATAAKGAKGRVWQDEGYWLLPPLLLLALFAFRRRGGALAALLLCAWLPWQPAQAADLWRRPDQVEHRRMQEGSQAYRGGDYPRAARLYRESGADSADAHYNLGNALAKAGQYPQAIAAYDRALRLQPGMADALANKRAVEAAMKRKPPPKDKSQQNQSSQGGQGQQQQQQNPQQGEQKQQKPEQGQPKPERDQSASPKQDPAAAAKAQEQADRAQRERMQRALQQQQGQQPAQARKRGKETAQQREVRIANEAWLKRVPDDPGGLLREKFRIEHERRQVLGEQGD